MNDIIKIQLFGEAFEICSARCESEIAEKLNMDSNGAKVFILPSLTADFKIRAYDSMKKECAEYYAAALTAAAFLIYKRGLPLSEINFETLHGNVRVFCTGNRTLKVRLDKCKLLLSAEKELQGCIVNYNDLFLARKIRAIHSEGENLFKEENLSGFVMPDSEFPSAVIMSSTRENVLLMKSYRDFTKIFVSSLLLWCCAAYNEAIVARRPVSRFEVSEYSASLEVAFSSVTVEVSPIIL